MTNEFIARKGLISQGNTAVFGTISATSTVYSNNNILASETLVSNASSNAYNLSNTWTTTNFVNVTGGTMTGDLTIVGSLSTASDLNLRSSNGTASIYTDSSNNLVLSSTNGIIFNPSSGNVFLGSGDEKATFYTDSNDDLIISGVANIQILKNTNIYGTLSASGSLYSNGQQVLPTDISLIESTSGSWNNAWTKVSTASATWNDAFTKVSTTSATWNDAYTAVSTTSASWNQATKKNVIIVGSTPKEVTIAQSGATYVVSAAPGGSTNVDFLLPNGTESDLGIYYTFVKFTSSAMITLSAGPLHKIDDSSLGGTFYAGSGIDPLSAQSFASCQIQLVLPDQWHVVTGRKIWTSTEWV